jgi:hypothetical protein
MTTLLVHVFIASSAMALGLMSHYGLVKKMYSTAREGHFLVLAKGFFLITAILWWAGILIWWITS